MRPIKENCVSKMGLVNDFITVLSDYAGFTGRARCREYWMFILVSSIIAITLRIFDAALGLTVDAGRVSVGVLGSLYALAICIPTLAVSVRRLHDVGRSGWWLLIGLLPLIGWIVLLVFLLTDSISGRNKWGPSPKF